MGRLVGGCPQTTCELHKAQNNLNPCSQLRWYFGGVRRRTILPVDEMCVDAVASISESVEGEVNMNIRAILSTVGIMGLVVATSGAASARSAAASLGQARQGSQANCFSTSFSTGAVTSTCSADWAAPLVSDNAGNKVFSFTARATAAGASCRAVTNNRFGTLFVATPFVALPVSATYVALATTAIALPGAGSYFVDCIMNNGASVNELDWVP